jgi:hypothetical protein
MELWELDELLECFEGRGGGGAFESCGRTNTSFRAMYLRGDSLYFSGYECSTSPCFAAPRMLVVVIGHMRAYFAVRT